jgi:uncharacterized Zn finger protein
MSEFSRTWWGKKFIDALEQFTDSARLGRGRSYARGGKVVEFSISKNTITATVRGSVNPYFGVYKEPRYKITIKMSAIPRTDWKKAIKNISSNARFVAQLMMNEMPDNIENAFSGVNLHLLPSQKSDFITHCSCPDWANPCKHIAGVYYLVAAELDSNPFLLFELRGLSFEELKKELAKSPLGEALVQELQENDREVKSSDSLFTRPVKKKITSQLSLKEFWKGQRKLPKPPEIIPETGIHALVVKKQGDFPPFWEKDVSFIEVMEDLYRLVRTRNKNFL